MILSLRPRRSQPQSGGGIGSRRPWIGIVLGHRRVALQDQAPACVVPLLDEDIATVAPMLELAYGKEIHHGEAD